MFSGYNMTLDGLRKDLSAHTRGRGRRSYVYGVAMIQGCGNNSLVLYSKHSYFKYGQDLLDSKNQPPYLGCMVYLPATPVGSTTAAVAVVVTDNL